MDIYAENIMDHYRHPRHKGKMKSATARAEDSNPLCGDEIAIDLVVDKNNTVKDAKFSGAGCAISQASASMLLDHIIGKKIGTIKKLNKDNVCEMLGVPLTPARLKCALLSLYVLKKAINRPEK
jgi:nitrogen fixation NifU-like protein